MKPTLRDIAKAVGVSPATVSLVLRDMRNISPDTRDQVLKVAAELGYSRQDKDGARADKPRKTLGLLLVIDQSFSYIALLHQHDHREPGEARARGRLRRRADPDFVPVDRRRDRHEGNGRPRQGRCPLHYANVNAFVRLEDRGIPVVVVMNNKHSENYYSVCSDDFHGAYEGTKYLIELGHRSLAYIGCDRFSLER